MQPEARFASVPINAHLGLRFVARDESSVEIAIDVARQHLQETGVVQGGVIAALADTAAVYLFLPTLAADQSMTSIEFKLNFVAAALEGRGPLVAKSRSIKRGKKIALASVDVTQQGELVATGLFTYIFVERRAPKSSGA
jgi:uncharacterized protein (TIGR00369 family)